MKMTKTLIVDGGEPVDVTDDGRVFHNGRALKQQINNRGYAVVHICNKTYFVHRLVAQAFIGTLKHSDYSIHVHHKNGDKTDNTLGNLEIISAKEHAILHRQKYNTIKICVVCGREYEPYKCNRQRQKTCSNECADVLRKNGQRFKEVSVSQFTLDGELIRVWSCGMDIQRETGFFWSNINKCCRGAIKTYKGYVWKYTETDWGNDFP